MKRRKRIEKGENQYTGLDSTVWHFKINLDHGTLGGSLSVFKDKPTSYFKVVSNLKIANITILVSIK